MSYALHLSLSLYVSSNFPTATYRNYYSLRQSSTGVRSLSCFSLSGSNNSESEESAADGNGESTHLILVERYSNGAAKRYIWDGESSTEVLLELQEADTDRQHDLDFSTDLTWLPDSIKDFILPAGFPGSVSDDYLDYMLWQFPTNITGWICHALVTSSLLKAVGLGSFSGSAAAASAAAIRWGFGSLFDDDPKQWRMYADFIGSAGSIFVLTTQLYPAYFLPLASLGNLSKAVARGLKDPSFRVIQNHFALSANLGDVAAKEEVWEVTAQLIGLALGILILDTPGLVKSYPALLATWMSMRLLHLWLRFQSLTVLKFKTINLKRARLLSKEHISHSKVLGCMDCNKAEDILSWQRFLKPRIIFGVPLGEVLGSGCSSTMVKKIFKLYAREKYVLTVDQWEKKDFEVLVAFKEGATSLGALRSVWQANWLREHWDSSVNATEALEKSLSELEGRFDVFMELLGEAGWDTLNINLNVPKDVYIED